MLLLILFSHLPPCFLGTERNAEALNNTIENVKADARERQKETRKKISDFVFSMRNKSTHENFQHAPIDLLALFSIVRSSVFLFFKLTTKEVLLAQCSSPVDVVFINFKIKER